MANASKPNPDAVKREVNLTRTFDAPRDLVFRAWTDPKHLAQWWGPHGFTNPVCEADVRPGGAIRIDMRGPDGVVYPMTGTFHEVVAPERLVFTSVAVGEGGKTLIKAMNTVTFAERDGKTTLTLNARVLELAPEFAANAAGMEEGWSQSLERLADQAASSEPGAFVVSRTFDAPRELVFKAWTEAERLAQWWGPAGMAVSVQSLDLRPGGVFRYSMKSPQGEMWGKFVYRDVVPPERLVFVVSFADAAGNTVRAPFSAEWPLEVLSTLTLEERDGRTTVTMRGVPIHATEAERKTFAAGHGSMTRGWGGTLDQLAAFLAKP
jgi:uncharacterized protein YndB with AHSA1/START domain